MIKIILYFKHNIKLEKILHFEYRYRFRLKLPKSLNNVQVLITIFLKRFQYKFHYNFWQIQYRVVVISLMN